MSADQELARLDRLAAVLQHELEGRLSLDEIRAIVYRVRTTLRG